MLSCFRRRSSLRRVRPARSLRGAAGDREDTPGDDRVCDGVVRGLAAPEAEGLIVTVVVDLSTVYRDSLVPNVQDSRVQMLDIPTQFILEMNTDAPAWEHDITGTVV